MEKVMIKLEPKGHVKSLATFNTVGRDLIHNTYHITHGESSGPVAGSSRGQPSAPIPSFNDAPIDLLSVHFTGREQELTHIAHAFARPRTDIPLRCVLFGDQGVGKSQLTYEWSRSTFAQGANRYVIWMSATTVEKLDQGFSKILHLINHQDRLHSDQVVRLTAARRWLEEVDFGNWLLVLDNVFPDVLAFIREHLPRKNGRGSILFTTRTRNVAVALASAAGKQHDIIQVSMLNVQDGAELFRGHFGDGEIDVLSNEVERIVKYVGCLPLAISHAAAYMKQSASTIDDMLALYESEYKIDLISWENTLSDYEHKSVTATFECQLDDLEQRYSDTSNFLKVLAYFDPECIPLNMLITGARASPSCLPTSLFAVIDSPIKRRNAITQLQNQCLTTYEPSSLSLRIHDLIQFIILEKIKKSGTEQQWFECAVEVACKAFDQIEDHGSPVTWPQCELLIPHIQSLTARQEISSKAKAQLLVANCHSAWYLRSRGRYGEAEERCVRVLADEEDLFGSEDLRTLGTMNTLAVVYREQGRYDDAEALFKRELQIRKKKFGSEHLSTLITIYSLAYVYYSQGRYEESEQLFKEVLEAHKKLLGSEHLHTLQTKNMLALVYYNQHRYNDAETLYTQVLQNMEEQFGPDHIHSAWTINNLGLVHHSQGHHDEAEKLFKRVLSIWENQLGSDHPNTLLAKNNLCSVYESQGQYHDAEELLVHVLARREEVLGHSHPHTRGTMDSLTLMFEKLGRFDDAAMVRRRTDQSS